MNLPALALDKRAITVFCAMLFLVGGMFSFFQLGQLEDPEFTIKTAAVTTLYPGASPEQVELEVTDRIETKLQEMGEVKNVYSQSRPGMSIIKVDIKEEYWADRIGQVWDVLRKKIRDVEPSLPPGAGPPQVGDDFGAVFGFLLAVTSDGYSYAELESHVKALRKELSLVPGVARADLWGAQDRRVYIDVSETQLSQLGLTPEQLVRTLQTQNMVVDAGRVDFQTQRFRIAPTGEFDSAEAIGELSIAGAGAPDPSGAGRRDEIIRIKDFATVTSGYVDPPTHRMRFNGRPGIALAMAPASGANVVAVGRAIDARLAELTAELPIGIEVERISWQSDLVNDSIRGFVVNLTQAVAIVLVVLALTMGWRVGVIIGISGLVFPILGTFVVMAIVGIDLHRVSLGALVIAMGMMVDNAIVVADGFTVKLARGMNRKQAAIEAAGQPAGALFGATVVACMAFFPIFLSSASSGEYAGGLFTVVAISLMLSWLFALTLNPLLCHDWLPGPKPGAPQGDAFGGAFFQAFRGLLAKAIRFRLLFMGSAVGLLLLSLFGFRFVPQMFFPDASRAQVMIDYWMPEGTRLQQTAGNLLELEEELSQRPEVTAVATFVGRGPPRFYLPVSPEDPNPAYAQIIVNVQSFSDVDGLIAHMSAWAGANVPEAMVRVRKYAVGAFDDWKLEARFSGPADASPEVLRRIADEAMAILRANPNAMDIRTNWRNPVRKLVPRYNQERGRWADISRDDLAEATRRAFDGVPVGQYREGDDLIPILVRSNTDERSQAAVQLSNVQVFAAASARSVPLSQVIDGIGIEWEDNMIWRWDRRRAITVQCSPNGVTAPTLRNGVLADFEAMQLPPGYRLDWDGEYNSSTESQQYLVPGIIPAVTLMVLILVVLFNAYRPPLIIFLVIPFVMIGITAGFLLTQTAFGFVALLGAMSLSGMMIKNAVVLFDQINANLADGLAPYDAVVEAAVSRLRPVINAAATTVLGVMPLLQDVFWVSLAMTIIFGLTLGTILTMVMVPVLYATFYRIPAPSPGENAPAP